MRPKKKNLLHNKNSKNQFPRGAKGVKNACDGEDGIKKLGMKKVHHIGKTHYYGKDGCYPNYSLISRWLRKHVGRPWDDVYSEICQQADDRNFVGHSLRESIEWQVEKNCYFEDGSLYTSRGWKLGGDYYVHPVSKTLEWIATVSRKRSEPDQTVFEIDGILYHKHDGCWYRVKMDVWNGKSCYGPPDQFLSFTYDTWNWGIVRKLRSKYVMEDKKLRYCSWKQSANSREINKVKKRFGVAA